MDVDIARRLVACHGWRWLRCCPVRHSAHDWLGVVVAVEGSTFNIAWHAADIGHRVRLSDVAIDTDSPALSGLVLHLVRLAWGEPHAFVQYAGEAGWTVVRPDGSALTWGTTGGELEALCLALESAPLPAAPA